VLAYLDSGETDTTPSVVHTHALPAVLLARRYSYRALSTAQVMSMVRDPAQRAATLSRCADVLRPEVPVQVREGGGTAVGAGDVCS
jgi:hypothetical protein